MRSHSTGLMWDHATGVGKQGLVENGGANRQQVKLTTGSGGKLVPAVARSRAEGKRNRWQPMNNLPSTYMPYWRLQASTIGLMGGSDHDHTL